MIEMIQEFYQTYGWPIIIVMVALIALVWWILRKIWTCLVVIIVLALLGLGALYYWDPDRVESWWTQMESFFEGYQAEVTQKEKKRSVSNWIFSKKNAKKQVGISSKDRKKTQTNTHESK